MAALYLFVQISTQDEIGLLVLIPNSKDRDSTSHSSQLWSCHRVGSRFTSTEAARVPSLYPMAGRGEEGSWEAVTEKRGWIPHKHQQTYF